MSRQKIAQVIVVEGRNDTNTLQRWFDCDTIETGGLQLSPAVMERIEAAAKTRGILIFTDPDAPGETIRRRIQQRVPNAQHVWIDRKKARTDKKVGVEHASRKDLEEALAGKVQFMDNVQSLSWAEFLDLGLTGDAAWRNWLCAKVHVGPCNAKTCWKRLNQMGIGASEIEKWKESYGKSHCDRPQNS
jgi:ribonuclease M5